jgi:hypothetical protein
MRSRGRVRSERRSRDSERPPLPRVPHAAALPGELEDEQGREAGGWQRRRICYKTTAAARGHWAPTNH